MIPTRKKGGVFTPPFFFYLGWYGRCSLFLAAKKLDSGGAIYLNICDQGLLPAELLSLLGRWNYKLSANSTDGFFSRI